MKFLRRLDVKLTLLMLLIVLVAAGVQSVVSILFIIRVINEYSMQALEGEWDSLNHMLAEAGCERADCIPAVLGGLALFDEASPAFFTDTRGRVVLKLPPDAAVDAGPRLRPTETMGALYVARGPEGQDLAFVRGELRSARGLLGYIYIFQSPVEGAGGFFDFLGLYRPVVLRSVIVSLAVAAVLAAALVGLLTRRLRRLTDAVAAYDPKKGLGNLRFRGGDEITTLATRFQEMDARIASLIGELERAAQARRQLIAGIGHDLRSPVTSIGVGLELLEGTGADRRLVDSLREDVDFLGRLIDDLFEIIQIRDRPGGPERKPELVGEILERAARSLYAVAEARGVALEVDAEGLPETMEINGRLLFRLFDNLLRNAILHGPPGSTVRLSARREDDRAVFDVTDEGPGIAGDPETIFERYVSRRVGGVGLGLALAREIAQSHGGDIEAADREGGGARFTVSMPIGGE